MDNLPTTYQGMKDYVRGEESQIKRNTKNTAELIEIISNLKPKINEIEKQLKEEKLK